MAMTPELRRPSRGLVALLILLGLSIFINYIDRGNLGTAASLIKNELHLRQGAAVTNFETGKSARPTNLDMNKISLLERSFNGTLLSDWGSRVHWKSSQRLFYCKRPFCHRH